ncbi:MAG: helix-turn-helix domain-containing protein [Verrucomicrobiales bacterium]|nr:helix-turn-helix domain-containing protein [Verrucomicrobiales bacterium]
MDHLPPHKGINDILTPEECAQWLQLSRKSLLRAIRAGRIPYHQLNARVYRFHIGTVLAALNRRDLFARKPRTRQTRLAA